MGPHWLCGNTCLCFAAESKHCVVHHRVVGRSCCAVWTACSVVSLVSLAFTGLGLVYLLLFGAASAGHGESSFRQLPRIVCRAFRASSCCWNNRCGCCLGGGGRSHSAACVAFLESGPTVSTTATPNTVATQDGQMNARQAASGGPALDFGLFGLAGMTLLWVFPWPTVALSGSEATDYLSQLLLLGVTLLASFLWSFVQYVTRQLRNRLHHQLSSIRVVATSDLETQAALDTPGVYVSVRHKFLAGFTSDESLLYVREEFSSVVRSVLVLSAPASATAPSSPILFLVSSSVVRAVLVLSAPASAAAPSSPILLYRRFSVVRAVPPPPRRRYCCSSGSAR